MAKRKVSKRISVETLKPIEFVEVQQRRLLQFVIDLTDTDSHAQCSHEFEQAKDAVVKPIVRYQAGDEQYANRVIKEAISNLKKSGARYVRAPKREVIHLQQVRMPEITYDLSPMDAVRKWLEIRPSKNFKPEIILRELESLIKEKEQEMGERLKPLSVAIRGIFVDDFMPFKGQYVIEDIEDGVCGVIGRYDDEDQRSNRAGKSAFLDSVFYSIFGESRKVQTLDKHIYDGSDKMSVGIALETEASGLMTIQRTIKKAGYGKNGTGIKSSLFVNDAQISRAEGKELVQNTLGTSRDDFLNTCYVRQGQLTQILEQTSSQLKDNIIRWKGLDIWFSLSMMFARAIVDMSKRIDETKMQIEIQEDDLKMEPPIELIESLRAEIKERDAWNKKFYASKAKIAEIKSRIKLAEMISTAKLEVSSEKEKRDELKQVRKEIAETKEQKRKIENANREADNLRERLKIARFRDECKESLKSIDDLKQREKELNKEKQSVSEWLESLLEKIGAVKSEIADAKKIIGQGFNGACVIDGVQCPRASEINSADEMKMVLQKSKDKLLELVIKQEGFREKKADIVVELDQVRSSLLNCRRNKEWLDSIDESESVEALEKKIKQFSSFIDSANESLLDHQLSLSKEREVFLIGELANIKKSKELIANNPKVPDIKKLVLEREKQESIFNEGHKNTGAQTRELKQLEFWEQRYHKSKGEVELLKSDLKRFEKRNRLYIYLEFLCGKKGIPSMMIEDSLNEIAVQVNEILKSLGTDHRLEFQFERELQSLAKTCQGCGNPFPNSARVKICEACGHERGRERTDELKPMVREGDRIQEFAQESGAGRALLALATRIVLSRFLGYSVLFLDEVCSSLDDYHLPTMIRLIRKLPDLGFKQVFVISHQKEIADAMPRNIMVTRYSSDNWSKVEWE